jgi:flagellar protein FlaG
MDVNQNQTNITPVDLKSPGFSALPKRSLEKTVEDTIVEKPKAKKLVDEASLLVRLEKEAEDGQKKVVKETDLPSAIVQINEHVQNIQRDIVFTIDEESGQDIVTIIDAKSEKVIRQIPSEEALNLSRRLQEQLSEGESATTFNLFKSTA